MNNKKAENKLIKLSRKSIKINNDRVYMVINELHRIGFNTKQERLTELAEILTLAIEKPNIK